MQEKETNNIFQNRIDTFEEYVEIFGEDDEDVEIYLYDIIAFMLSANNEKKQSNRYVEIIKILLSMAKNNIVNLKGTKLKELYGFIKNNGLPRELETLLLDIYKSNEEKREIKYNLDYKYYNNNNEYKKLALNYNKLELEIDNKINNIYNIKENDNYNDIYNNDYSRENNNYNDIYNNDYSKENNSLRRS